MRQGAARDLALALVGQCQHRLRQRHPARVLDLVVVFLFRHPIMTMFARTRAFLSPRVSGLGRALPARSAESGAARNPRVKEA